MNPEVERRLNWQVDRWCAENKAPLFGYDHAHVCTSNCRMVGDFPYFICVSSRKLHVCGKECRNTYTTSEGTFCALTGFEVHGPDDETSSLVVRDSCGKSTRHWGDRIRMGKKRARRPSTRSPTNSIDLFERAVRLFLLSEERHKLYRAEMAKFGASVKKAAKKHLGSPIGLQDASAIVSNLVSRHEPLCSPPPCKTTRWVGALAREINNFWKQLDFKCTRKSVNALVAVSLSMMAKKEGYACDGVVYVRHSPTLAQHVVSDMQFGRFSGLTCRRMSIVHRGLMKACLTPSGKQRIIEPLHFLVE